VTRIKLIALVLLVSLVGVGFATDILTVQNTLPKEASANMVKIDYSKNIAVISWDVSDANTKGESDLLLSLYRVDAHGNEVVVAECDIDKPAGEYVIDLSQVPKEWMVKGEYYAKIRAAYTDEHGESKEAIADNKRIDNIPAASMLKYDPGSKGESYPVKVL